MLLCTALHGLYRSGFDWGAFSSAKLQALGWKVAEALGGTYYKKGACFLMNYVDDFILAGPADEAWRELQAISKVIKLTSMYLANDFLGIVISEIQSGPRSF